jgi:hypothetical protein
VLAGTRMDLPSIVMSIIPGGVVAVVILGADANALSLAGARRGVEADAAGALAM